MKESKLLPDLNNDVHDQGMLPSILSEDIIMELGEELIKMVLDDKTILYFDKDSNYHRVAGPACIEGNGDGSWWRHGLRHRLDGPAVCLAHTDYVEYHLEGCQLISKEDITLFIKLQDCPIEEVPLYMHHKKLLPLIKKRLGE
jgi:hypothetical protein